MALPSVRRISDGQSGLQDRPSSRAATARHGGVNDSDAWIQFLVTVKQGIKRRDLAARGPPGKDFQLCPRGLNELASEKTGGRQFGRASQFRKNKFHELLRPLIPGIRRNIQVEPARERIALRGNSKGC